MCECLIISNLDAEEAHEGYSHEGRQNECDAHTAKGTRNIGIGRNALADGSDGSDGKKPAEPPAAAGTYRSPDRGKVTLLHEKRATENGAVYGYERKEDAKRRIERGTVFLDRHLDKLGH